MSAVQFSGTEPPNGVYGRSERFLKRIDIHLAGLRLERIKLFLRKQIAIWERRYRLFLRSEGASEPTVDYNDPPHATDFVNIISGLAMRLSSTHQTGTRLVSGTQVSFAKSSLSLLVTADRCCPTIIGQAHVLYYCGSNATQRKAALSELKAALQCLFTAVSTAEGSLNEPTQEISNG